MCCVCDWAPFLPCVLEARTEALIVPSGSCLFFAGMVRGAPHQAFPAPDPQHVWREMVVW